MIKRRLFLPFVVFCGTLSAQEKTPAQPNRTSPVTVSCSYRMPVNKNLLISSGHGVSIELGINPVYFYSDKRLLGLYVGMAMKDRLWNTSFSSSFTSDYNSSIKDVNYSELDSSMIAASKKLFSETTGNTVNIPGCESASFHSSAFYGGILTKLPFERYPVLVKLYGGMVKTSFQGTKIVTTNTDFNYFAIRRPMCGFEFTLFPGKKLSDKKDNYAAFTKMYLGALSFYYEYCNLSEASLYFTDGSVRKELAFNNYLTDNFTSKYKKEISFGLKLSVNVF